MLVHCTLPDYEQPGWLMPQVMGGIGALILLWRPSMAGFLLCTVSLLIPLMFLRDVLTQSMYLVWVGCLGTSRFFFPNIRILDGVRVITGITYLIAALHKINTEFLDPAYSCAHHAAQQIAERWSLLSGLDELGVTLSVGVIIMEVVLGFGIILGRPWIWLLGVIFHVPLTATLAPAFGAVMLSGYVACLTPRHLVLARACFRRHKISMIGAVFGTSILSLIIDGGLSDWWMALKIGVGVALALWSLLAIGAWSRDRRPINTIGYLVGALWFCHGLTPYVAVQYQHTGAMLSNLRIDEGCANSYIFPKAWLRNDPYIRIDEARIGRGQRPQREALVEATLWNAAAIHTMRKNWCVAHLRPIFLQGSWAGSPFEIQDLCGPDWLAEEPRLDRPLMGFQRFQKNLLRRCPTACIH